MKNDPNVLAGKAANPTHVSALKPRKKKKTLKTETQPTAGKDSTGEKKREAPEKRETKGAFQKSELAGRTSYF